jgi:hypothetical protein
MPFFKDISILFCCSHHHQHLLYTVDGQTDIFSNFIWRCNKCVHCNQPKCSSNRFNRNCWECISDRMYLYTCTPCICCILILMVQDMKRQRTKSLPFFFWNWFVSIISFTLSQQVRAATCAQELQHQWKWVAWRTRCTDILHFFGEISERAKTLEKYFLSKSTLYIFMLHWKDNDRWEVSKRAQKNALFIWELLFSPLLDTRAFRDNIL